MIHNYSPDSDKFVVVYDNVDYCVCIFVEKGQTMSTAQPFYEAFDTFAQAQLIFGEKITDPTIIPHEE